MTVEKRNGRYRARFRGPDGRERSRTFDLMRDANEWLDNQRADMSRGTWVDPRFGKQTFLAFADEWAEAQDGWKASTRGDWPVIRKRLKSRVGAVRLAAFDPMVLQRLRGDLAKTYAPSTVKLTMRYVGMILRSAYRSRRIGFDPTIGMRAKRARAGERDDRVSPEDVPTRAEALAILAATPAPFRAGVALGLSGLRVGEVLGVTTDRLDLAARRVTVDRQADDAGGWTTPKNEKVRTITVPGWVAVELRRHVRDYGDGVLFVGPLARGRRRTMRRDAWYTQAWHRALRGAGLFDELELDDGETEIEWRFVFHGCRHWCASTLLAEGAPITAVAGYLGDTVETVSRTYAHWLRDDQEVPAEVLDRVVTLASPQTEPAATGRS